MNHIVVRAIMEFIFFLDECDDSVVDCDQAVALQEATASTLAELDASGLRELASAMQAVANTTNAPDRHAAYKTMFDDLGLRVRLEELSG